MRALLNNSKFHGLLSLLLVFIALVLAIVSIFDKSTTIGITYMVIIIISFPIIVYSYCSKCLCCGGSCGHILPGKLTLLLPSRQQTGYGFPDYAGIIFPGLLMVGFPQWWLWKDKVLLILFWVLVILAVIEIWRCICPECSNINCPACNKSPKHQT